MRAKFENIMQYHKVGLIWLVIGFIALLLMKLGKWWRTRSEGIVLYFGFFLILFSFALLSGWIASLVYSPDKV